MHTRILLAEDDVDDIEFFSEFLEERNDISLLPSVKNGEELLNILRERDLKPDLIILDHNMPKLNGFQTLTALKDDPDFASIPVVIYSTFANDGLIKNSLACGALAVYNKPSSKTGYQVMMDDLMVKLNKRE